MDAILTTRRRLLLAGAGATLLAACGRTGTDDTLHLAGATMGTRYNLKLPRAGLRVATDAIHAAVQGALDDVEQRMSIYRPDSEVSRFNRHPAGVPFALSGELAAVLAAAQTVSRASHGAFDVTVAPLVEVWGFGTEKRRAAPSPQRLREARRATAGHAHLHLDLERRQATKGAPLSLDLGAIAKGHGVNRAAQALDALGLSNYMIEAGGEVRTHGTNGAGQPWQIGIEQPDAVPPRVHAVVPLSGQSMATSGDYRIYFEEDGRRYSHEIDPRSGQPITHRLCSVTVVHDDCMQADALATALIVMGSEAGLALAESLGLAACFIEREAPGRYVTRHSSIFPALVLWPKAA